MRWKFLQKDLGTQAQGTIVEVTLDNVAFIRLVDDANIRAYKTGRQAQFHGTRASHQVTRLAVPRTGRWHLVVDRLGMSPANVQCGVRVSVP